VRTEPAALPAGERELVGRFLATRDEESFLSLYRAHAGFVFRVLARVLGEERGDLDDVFQETWRRCADRLATFAFGSSLRTWLCGIALNCAREALRARRAGFTWEEVELDELSSVGEDAPDLDASPRELEAAIARLPAGYRAVLVLHDVEEHTHEEIAALLGIRPGTSKSQLARARAWLRRAVSRGGVREGGTT